MGWMGWDSEAGTLANNVIFMGGLVEWNVMGDEYFFRVISSLVSPSSYCVVV